MSVLRCGKCLSGSIQMSRATRNVGFWWRMAVSFGGAGISGCGTGGGSQGHTVINVTTIDFYIFELHLIER